MYNETEFSFYTVVFDETEHTIQRHHPWVVVNTHNSHIIKRFATEAQARQFVKDKINIKAYLYW